MVRSDGQGELGICVYCVKLPMALQLNISYHETMAERRGADFFE
jgi:hypothetical protein